MLTHAKEQAGLQMASIRPPEWVKNYKRVLVLGPGAQHAHWGCGGIMALLRQFGSETQQVWLENRERQGRLSAANRRRASEGVIPLSASSRRQLLEKAQRAMRQFQPTQVLLPGEFSEGSGSHECYLLSRAALSAMQPVPEALYYFQTPNREQAEERLPNWHEGFFWRLDIRSVMSHKLRSLGYYQKSGQSCLCRPYEWFWQAE